MNHETSHRHELRIDPTIDDVAVFAIWERARSEEERILAALRDAFEVLAVVEVEWDPARFSEHLTRFYGTLLPAGSNKEEHCGTGPFVVVVVRDPSPTYEVRPTSKGWKRVQKRVFDAKQEFRTWTGGGHRIHASNDPMEAMHDLHLLLGTDFDRDPIASWRSLDSGGTLRTAPPGDGGWASVDAMFRTLNHTQRYVVLRNFEGYPDSVTLDGHDDVDLLVPSFRDAVLILGARSVFEAPYRVHTAVDVGGVELRIDLRHVGDRYYDANWQGNMLQSRVRLPSGIYTPDRENHFFGLVYHALVHKQTVAPDYLERFERLERDTGLRADAASLATFMNERGYLLAPPEDRSVGFHAPQELVSSVTTPMAGRIQHGRNVAKGAVKSTLRTLGLLDTVKRWLGKGPN